ncbi:molybdopterin synthase [Haloparvum sp. PAK95]|uniref:molybdopterin synthase n=1 Tax=Haloparvum sp. PAK95 TaxID=3418962 RepID=UPI003D2F3D61
MQPLSVLGADATSLADALVSRLDGRVVIVEQGASGAEPPGKAAAEVRLAQDGSWQAAGDDADFDELLDRFAPAYDYLIAVGHTRLRVPTVLVSADEDPGDVPGEVIAEADAMADVDVDALIDDLDDATPWITLQELIEQAKADPQAERSGAIASFTGRVRAKDAPDDDRTTHLAFEKYEGVAADRMAAIESELEERDGVFRVLMHHRTGVIEDGEDIVFVVVLAGHRTEAFETVEDGINRLKDEVPIFKKETTEAEEFWVHQRD